MFQCITCLFSAVLTEQTPNCLTADQLENQNFSYPTTLLSIKKGHICKYSQKFTGKAKYHPLTRFALMALARKKVAGETREPEMVILHFDYFA